MELWHDPETDRVWVTDGKGREELGPLAAAALGEFADENARLLDEKIDAYNDKVLAELEADELRAENARLRELVRALDWCTENFDSPTRCDRCPLGQTDGLTPECEVRMRELGVEVDR